MTLDITLLIGFICVVIVSSLTYYALPWLKEKRMIWLVGIAVSAAEQVMKSSTGKEKKEYVINWLKERNITYNEALIDAMIEAAVYDIKAAAAKK